MAILVTGAPPVLVALQGKSEPSAAKGDVDGLPYGNGDAIIMCALLVAVNIAMAEAASMDLMDMVIRYV